MKEKQQLLVFITVLVSMIIAASTTAYAYFTAKANIEFKDKVSVTSATVGQAYATSGSTINFVVPKRIMGPDQIDKLNPAITAEAEDPIEFVLKTSEGGEELRCLYDLVYTPVIPYINSAKNINNDFELTIKASEVNLNKEYVEETSLGNVSTEKLLKKDIQIVARGVLSEVKHSWVITAGYYNQDFNQDENAYENFEGSIEIKNIRCETFAEAVE